MPVVMKQIEQAAAVNLMTTELNALANNTGATSSVGGTSGVFNNVVGTANMDGNLYGKLEFLMGGTATAFTINGSIKVWFLSTNDGTNYEDVPPVRAPDAVIQLLEGVTVAQRKGRPRVTVPVGKFRTYVQNSGTNQTMPATGNILSLLLGTDQGA